MNIYVTADQIGSATGGGLITFHESESLKSLGPCEVLGREELGPVRQDPWGWDGNCYQSIVLTGRTEFPKLSHFYAGTFSTTINELKRRGSKITYTAAAHDIDASRRAHEDAGIPFNYPHLTDPELWNRYLGGYLAADIVICPSWHSANVMRGYGCKRVEIIPHGCNIPAESVASLPCRFTVGYMGSCSAPDKGVKYLLQAWKKLNYSDATLVLAGRDSNSPYVANMVREFGGGSIQLRGWVDNVDDFYNSLSLYVQPSVTEGFGLEVLEAYAHGRPVLCSNGVGAISIVIPHWEFPHSDSEFLAAKIRTVRKHYDREHLSKIGDIGRGVAESFTWDKIRSKYVKLWKELLCEDR